MTAPCTQDELRALMRERESDRVERKRSAADGSGIRRNLCAFANDLPGRGAPGVIFVGVEDDGRCAGLRIDDRLLRELAGMKDDGNILPLPSITVEKRHIDYRNALLAEIMHHLGFAQRFGLGVPLADRALRENGNPPAEFEFQPAQVTVTLRPAG